MSQPSPWVSPFYGTLSPTGPSHPINRVTPYGTGHTLQVELIRELERPIE